MSISEWQPAKQIEFDQVTLKRYVQLAIDANEADLAASMPAQQISDERLIMKRLAKDWQLADALQSEEIVALVRFFTLAEQQLSGWEAGKDSPVIPLVKLLKQRGEFTSELRKWIKQSSDNRYLPNGPL